MKLEKMIDNTNAVHGMRVLALTRYSRLGASSRMRSYQYVDFLREHGVDVVVSPLFGDSYLKRLYNKGRTNWPAVAADYFMQLIRLGRARNFDLVWIEKEIFPSIPAWFERALAKLGIPYVVDYDDAIFHNYDLSSNRLQRLLSNKIPTVMRGAALVVCGNEYLADCARNAGARDVAIIPTVIDLDRYSVRAGRAGEKLVIGWIGSPSTVKYLRILHQVLAEISAIMPLQLRVIGATLELEGVDVDCRTWSEASEVAEIQQFDIGIMPLVDSPWEKGKCGYKLIQYMACGVPVIASPVGINNEVVSEGINGYLCRDDAEWKDKILALSGNAAARVAMGRMGRKAVEDKYCVQVTTPELARLFHAAAQRRIA